MSILDRAKDQRTPSEAVFQGAMMEFANGGETYDVNTMRSTRGDGTTHAGLNGAQIENALNNLFDIHYSTKSIDSN